MDIYGFLNSRDIAEHCRGIGHTWNPFEMAVIVGRSDKPIKERHRAFREIVARRPDMPTPRILDEGIPEVRHEGYPSLHGKIGEFVGYEERCIDLLKTPERDAHYRYKETYGTVHTIDGIWTFSTFENLWAFISGRLWGEDKRGSSGCAKHFEDSFRVKIEKVYLDEDASIEATLDIHGDIYELLSDNYGKGRFHARHFPETDEDIVDLFRDDVYVNIPVPFKKGDVLYDTKHRSVCVLELIDTEMDCLIDGEHAAITGDSVMTGELGAVAYMDARNNLSLHPIMEYDSYEYHRGKLCGNDRMLHFVSLFWKGELGIDDLLAMNSEILLDNIRYGIRGFIQGSIY